MRGRAGSWTKRLRADLDRSLFPQAPAGGGIGFGRWEGAAVLVAFLALASILHLLRAGASDSLTSLWAEDGAVFLHGALSQGFLDAVTSSYAGYLVLVPRLIGEVGASVPLEDAPVAMNLAAVLVVALSGLAVWFGSSAHVRDPFLRGLLVALTVLCPVASLEAVVSGTYDSWYMIFAVFWLLLWRPNATWSAALGALFIFVTGLTTPGIAFFIPLAALRALAIRDRRDALIVGSFTLALAIQLPVTALNSEDVIEHAWSADAWPTYAQRVVEASVLGENLGGQAWSSWGWQFLIPFVAAGVALLAVAFARASSGRLLAAIAVVTSLTMFMVTYYQRAIGAVMLWPDSYAFGLGGRYALVPSLLLISSALVLVGPSTNAARGRGRGRPWATIAVGGVLLVALVTSFDLSNSAIRKMPPWQDSLRAAASTCRAKDLAETHVGVSPPGVVMYIPCERLESAFDQPPAR